MILRNWGRWKLPWGPEDRLHQRGAIMRDHGTSPALALVPSKVTVSNSRWERKQVQMELEAARNRPATHDVITPRAAIGPTHSTLVRVLLGLRCNPRWSLRGHLVDAPGNAL